MSADLQVSGKNTSFWISSGGRTVAGPYTTEISALAALRGVARRIRPVRPVACLCCRKLFNSTGPGNRLCPSCRREA